MGTKRGNNEGSVAKRPGGRWEARITLADGQRKRFYAKTRQEAAKKLTAALRDRDAGLPVVGDKQTFAQFIATWLDTARPSIKAKTYRSYEQLLRVHVLPLLGATPISKVTAHSYSTCMRRDLNSGPPPPLCETCMR